MIKRMFVAFGIVLLVAGLAGVSGVQAAPQAVDLSKAEEVQRVVKRVLSDVFLVDLEPKYGTVKFDKVANRITVSDISWNKFGDEEKYKKLEIINYQEDTAVGEYSYDKAEFTDGFSKFKEPLTAVDGSVIGDAIRAVTNITSGVKGSEKNKTLYINDQVIKSILLKGTDLIHNKPVVFEIKKAFVTNVDKVKLSFIAFSKVMSKHNSNQSDEEFIKSLPAFLDFMSVMNDNFSSEFMTARDFPTIPISKVKGVQLNLGTISIKNISKRSWQEVSIEGMEVSGPDNTDNYLKIKKLSFSDLKLKELLKFVNATQKIPNVLPTPQQRMGLLKALGGISFDAFESSIDGGKRFSSGKVSWGKYVGLIPTEIILEGSSEISPISKKIIRQKLWNVEAVKQIISALQQMGMEKLSIKMTLKVAWDEKTQKIVITPLIYDMDDLFSLSFSASLGNVPRSTLEVTDPKKLGLLLMGATAGPVTLEIKDKGAQMIYEKLAKGSLEGFEAAVVPDPAVKALFADIIKLANSPKGSLKVTLKPIGSVALAQLAGAFAVSPAALPSLFDISSEYSK